MCDYSLELYRSRPAQVGESYETYRFPSGTVGFIAPGDASTAVCMAYDTRLRLERIPEAVRNACGVTARRGRYFHAPRGRPVPRWSALPQRGASDSAAAWSGREGLRHRRAPVAPLGAGDGRDRDDVRVFNARSSRRGGAAAAIVVVWVGPRRR